VPRILFKYETIGNEGWKFIDRGDVVIDIDLAKAYYYIATAAPSIARVPNETE